VRYNKSGESGGEMELIEELLDGVEGIGGRMGLMEVFNEWF
jgi:hypothetical protein